jgi:iron-sulfur cluster assembly protein
MSTDFPVEVTEEAAKQALNLLERRGGDETFLRIGIKGGGCSGLEYVIKLEEQMKPHDLVYEKGGLKIVCDAKSALYLKGSSLVWTGNLIGGGFQFNNPNAERSCGCGTSFTPKPKKAG